MASSQLSRVRASFGVATGLAAIALGVFLRTLPALDTAWCGVAIALALASILAAYVAKPQRDPLPILGTALASMLLALILPILALLEPAVRPTLLPAALELAGGFTLLVAALRWSQANAVRALAPRTLDRKKKVRVERNNKRVDVPADALAAGDRIFLAAGDDIPVDGTVLDGSGFVDETALLGPALPSAKKPGDTLLAGTDSSIPELTMRAETPLAGAILLQREALLPSLATDLAKLSAIDLATFAASTAIALAGSLLIAAQTGLAHVETYLPAIGAIMLAACAGPSLSAAIRGRLRVLAIARAAGLVVSRTKDVLALARVRRWQIDANLLAAPGAVEAIALSGEPPDRLLQIAAALLADAQIPEAKSVDHAIRAKKLPALHVAAQKRQGSLYLGTVEGVRWFMGPPRAVEEEEGMKLDKSMEGPLEFLRGRQMITWLIGRPGKEITGAIGIGLETELDAKTAAAKLRATIMPGPPDGVRKTLADKANLRTDGPPIGKRDATLLNDDAPPPPSGLRIRVLPVKTRLGLDDDRSPRLFLPSLGNFGEAVARAKDAVWSAQLRSIALAVLPGLCAVSLAFFGLLPPLAALLLVLLALVFAGKVEP